MGKKTSTRAEHRKPSSGKLSHYDDAGRATMVDVSGKTASRREAEASAFIEMSQEVLKALPPGAPPPKNPVRIKWSLVCMGYQPELAAAWSACTKAFGEEAKQDRVFEESLFWVVTRSLQCFY